MIDFSVSPFAILLMVAAYVSGFVLGFAIAKLIPAEKRLREFKKRFPPPAKPGATEREL